MALITVPTKFAFAKVNSFELQRATNIIRSKYTGQAQRIIYPFAVWGLDAQLTEYDGLDAGKIRSFLVKLEGQKNTFKLPVPGFVKPMTGYSGDGQVSSIMAAQASSIVVKGLTASTSIVAEGDYFVIQDELKMATSAVSSNASGIATISFGPPARKAAAINVAVLFQNPYCLMTAAEDDVASWGVAPPIRQAVKFLAVEAVEI